MRRVAKWLGLALGVLLLLIVALGAWGVHSQSAARWIARIHASVSATARSEP